ncbi:MAG: acyl carrier protein phosphodiesterase [Bacteroidetes bacterium]|nr:acyl carrier protein phosphodiesterase [Bacteroidota bacterium]
MNFLAHLYLSGDDHQYMIGNFIADFVKGNKKDLYPLKIKQGIELHRMIDDFTDHHEITERSKARLRHKYGKYSGVIVDLYYDHFLAANFGEFHKMTLHDFSKSVYEILEKNREVLPERVHHFLPFMMERNWLLNYASIEGIGRALTGLSTRVSFENKMNESTVDLQEQYASFENDFREFFPYLESFVKDQIVRFDL